ncbi:hypothetical protein ASPFODRAFT_178342 [Aspergillus luchuensis CBS 106.47]|uniref:Cytochrome P450 n=1 Tax=Aspergillus luchuensis (strain CBS 106.47) TaxID=1137211 RepID=A0A1M3U1N0_ASPLC|nr:hypothetical protein ASPFODRAFT_178342 [Aspergillus luchuensis CBS 106.47]
MIENLEKVVLFEIMLKTVVLLAIVTSLKAIYNSLWHPLKSYPGPFLAVTSRVPITYITFTGRKTVWLHSLHLKYGPVVRVAPNELSYMSQEALNDIYGRAESKENLRNDDIFYTAFEGDKSTIMTTDEASHARLRRTYAQFFARQNLENFEPLFNRYSNLLVQRIRDTKQAGVDIIELFSFALFDLMGHLQFGQSLQLLERSARIQWAKSQPAWIRASVIAASLAEFPLVKTLFKFLFPTIIERQRRLYFAFTDGILNRRLQGDSNDPDLITFVLQSEGAGLSKDEVISNAPFFMLAGTETSSSALCGLVAHILKMPDVLQRLTEEVRSSISDPEFISMRNAHDLVYLDACIKETLRRYPPIPEIMPRVTCPQGAFIAGKWVPGGTRVYVSLFSSMNSGTYFEEPTKFVPDRWLKRSGLYLNDKTDAFQPFSKGKKACIGQDMAYYIIRLFICKLLCQFDISSETDIDGWLSDQRTWAVWRRSPLLIRAEPRNSVS